MARDIVDLLLADHEEFRRLMTELEGTPPEDRQEPFQHLVRELARHEAAEEAIVHSALRDDVPQGAEVAAAVLEEESQAENLLSEMEELDPSSEEFLASFRDLRRAVLEHAEHEERDEFPLLREHLSQEHRQEMGEAFEKLKDLGPTRPHPLTPQTPEVRAAVGPIAGIFDRARDKARELLAG